MELTLAAEIMGRYSNIILIDENGKIVDALKRVDAEMSSERLVLPGLLYRLPPPQDKLSMLQCTAEEVLARIDALPRDMELSKALPPRCRACRRSSRIHKGTGFAAARVEISIT